MTQPLLAIDNLSVGFRQQETVRIVVNSLSLRVDAGQTLALVGESGSGKSVTAIYEITPKSASASVDALRYQTTPEAAKTKSKPVSSELAFLKIRYKKPNADKSILITQPIIAPKTVNAFDKASENQRFASAVAGFGQLLRQSPQMGHLSYQQVLQIAQQAKTKDNTGVKGEFIQLVKNAQALAGKAE